MDISQIKPFSVQGFLSNEQYSEIYKTINDQISKNIDQTGDKWSNNFVKVRSNGFIVYYDKFSESLISSLKQRLEEVIGHPINRPGVLFARYTHESGRAPRLRPHIDRAMRHPAITCAVELDTPFEWDIYVNDEKFNVDKSDAVIFSGSHQVHWRPDAYFKEDEYYDIMIIQSTLDKPDDVFLTDEFFDNMDKISGDYSNKYRHLLENSLSGPEEERQ